MCKKSIYKKSFLLYTIAGTLLFPNFCPTHADTLTPEVVNQLNLNNGESETFDNVLIRHRGPGVSAHDKSVLTIKNSTIQTELAALSVSTSGRIDAKRLEANTRYIGLETRNGIINVEDSNIIVKKGGSGGIVFYETPKNKIKEGEHVVNRVNLTNTKLIVEDGVGIRGPYGSKAIAEVHLKNSEIRADMLLRNKTRRVYHDEDTLPVSLTLTAKNSILEGRARTLKVNTTVLTLSNNSKWYLKVSQEDVDTDFSTFNFDLSDIKQRALSTVSVLNLDNSSIVFNVPPALAKSQYQTLSVGRTAEVYKSRDNMVPTVATAYHATGDAKIYFNTEWSDGLTKEQQKTDRLLVHGNVSGTTTIYFNSLSKNEKTNAADSVALNMRGISLIQVSGKTDETAFKLAHGYITMDGLPYKYTLNAYGPTSSRGKANGQQSYLGEISQESEENALKDYTSYVIKGNIIEGISKNDKGESAPNHGGKGSIQRHLKKDDNFWDFRLQSATLDGEEKVKALVPQVASYLVMPQALFSAGLSDVNNQNTLLDTMQTKTLEIKNNKNNGIFVSTYGNRVTLSSSRSPLQYGYGADVNYAALQAGIRLAALEDQDITTNFGLLGTYGKLAFTPKDIEGADKSTLDKWLLAAYGSIRHNYGFYVNALFSYGILKGNITTIPRGNTAELNNTNTLNVSAIIGQKLTSSAKGLVFEPQAQLIYQRLMLGTLSDVDGFNVNMGSPHQWLVRVGGRLTQDISTTKEGSTVSLHGKLNFIRAFGDKGTIQIGDTFHLNYMKSSIEGGLGVNAQLSQNIVLHADVNYQQKLQKDGLSGMYLSGGMRYRF
ncbi:outer membrane autotransporter barrel domain-containing protein [Bartonella sp. DB5-6]|uniref:autotransporter outer membrane beta-barrel domain-containing protein n=1 Tax=Bartonella sp. DB5-6 TaxID=1094755 RepID=UPI00026E931B|nr:autotransporter outer membrane beta-barrel domain-containing protein [Bartonella sp. DB5-6]EJF76674.1 outer membrane autotransporter barrel domain-containing protein [Bartonella sp. DB5-6]